jgi:hypothetical protein
LNPNDSSSMIDVAPADDGSMKRRATQQSEPGTTPARSQPLKPAEPARAGVRPCVRCSVRRRCCAHHPSWRPAGLRPPRRRVRVAAINMSIGIAREGSLALARNRQRTC